MRVGDILMVAIAIQCTDQSLVKMPATLSSS